MKFTGHSSSGLFGNRMKRYAEEKLQRPLIRHKLDGEDVQIKSEAEENGNQVNFKLSVSIPGEDTIVISVTEDRINGAIDVAADKLERVIRSLKSKKKNRREQTDLGDYTEEFGEDDYLTDGEEDVLRDMGALDDILGI
tara:strand:+ start:536 stop:952 length:417 start_codon:yes stop_codon:yes gene_type:complete